MKREVSFVVEDDRYRINGKDDADNEISFSILKKDGKFNSKTFYTTFFKGISEPVSFSLKCSDELSSIDKYYYRTMQSIFDDVCTAISEQCFSDESPENELTSEVCSNNTEEF